MKKIAEIKIEKNIPVPPYCYLTDWVTLLKQLKVGDSFLVPGMTTSGMSGRISLQARMLGIKLTMRTINGENGKAVRVWRIK